MLIALFPIKEKSQRIKNKNFKLFCGKPLYRWMLEKLIKNKNINKIIINTDSKILLNQNNKIHKKVIVRKREKSLIGHDISMNKIIKNDIDFTNRRFENINEIIFLMTHSTNPLISNKTINKCYEKFMKCKTKIDSLFSVNSYKSRFYDHNVKPINHNPKKLIQTQFLKEIHEENSCIYLFTKKSFFKNNARIGIKPMVFKTPIEESIDIDEQSSWDFAINLMDKNANKD